MKILILGIDGFIGSSLTKAILAKRDWQIAGIDINDTRVAEFKNNNRFNFVKGDIANHKDWVSQQIKASDIVIPLIAIATPMLYVKDPIRVYHSVFESNMNIIQQCVEHGKRIIFPSSSEVYGMSEDESFNEETSSCVLGPINKERWIYSCSKQLLDRVIWSYGHQGLKFTLFRPFNWIGGAQDDIHSEHARLIPKFLGNILRQEPMILVGGGEQRRSFTDISDGVGALIRIIDNTDNQCDGRIFNIGNPGNNYSVKDIAQTLINVLAECPEYRRHANLAQFKAVSAKEFYGPSYQDVKQRVPDISAIKSATGWQPTVSLKQSIEDIVHYHLSNEILQQPDHLVS